MIIQSKELKLEGCGEHHAVEVLLASCFHHESPGFMHHAFRMFKEHAVKDRVKSVLFAGDTNDMTRTAVRTRLEEVVDRIPGATAGRVALDREARRLGHDFLDRIDPFKKKVDAWTLGNHTWRLGTFDDGDRVKRDPESGRPVHAPPIWVDEWMANKIDATFAEGLIIQRYRLCVGKNTRLAVFFGLRHSRGGGRTQAGDENVLIRELNDYTNLNVMCGGHTHHCYTTNLRQKSEILSSLRIHAQNRIIARAGTFDRMLLEGPEASYGEAMAMPLATIGYVKFRLWIDRHAHGGKEIYEPVIEATPRIFT